MNNADKEKYRICKEVEGELIEQYGKVFVDELNLWVVTSNKKLIDESRYQKSLEVFHYIFAMGERGKIYLCKIFSLASSGHIKLKMEDWTEEEQSFFNSWIDRCKSVNNHHININAPLISEHLELAPYKSKADQESLRKSLVLNGADEFEKYTEIEYEYESEDVLFGNKSLSFGIYLGEKIIGEVSLELGIGVSTIYNLNYYIIPEYRNNGYCTEAAQALVRAAFDNRLKAYEPTLYQGEYEVGCPEVNVIKIHMSSDNTASIRIAEKLGAKYDACVSCESELYGKFYSEEYYILYNPRIQIE